MKRFFALVPVFLLAAVASAQPGQPPPKCATPGQDNALLGIQTIRLWPGAAPEAKGSACNDTPAITIFDPQPGTANGSAILIFPGGAYANLAANLEGRQFADWFAARGFKAFILTYRLTSNGYVLPIPLLDARRAIQTVRARANDYHIDPNRIGVIGFSAGGHLAALAGTQFVAGKPDAEDPIERTSSRPDFLVLGYPWLDAITTDTSYLSYCKMFNLMDQCNALKAKYDPVLFVTKETPPTFIYQTFADKTVSPGATVDFYQALFKAGVPSEMHVFTNGAHGSGLGKGDAALDQWPTLMEAWLRGQNLMPPPQRPTR